MSDDHEAMPNGEEHSSADELSAYDVAGVALGAASTEENAALNAAMADPHVVAELAAYEATLAELARLAPLQSINRGRSAGIRSRLISRATASREARTGSARFRVAQTTSDSGRDAGWVSAKAVGTSTHQSPQIRPIGSAGSHSGGAYGNAMANVVAGKGRPRFNWLALAASFILVAVGAELAHVVEERNQLRKDVAAHDSSLLHQVASLQSSIATKDSLIAALTGPQMKVVDLVNYSSQDPVARMFWDRSTQEWTMYAYHLRPPKPGKTFQVWLITNTSPNPVSAGTFTPDVHGAAVLHARYPLDRQALTRVAVSEEPEGGVPTPTGPIIIAGMGR